MIDRRDALRLLGAGALAAMAPRTAEAAAKPNILWLSCEDISSHLGCYGDPHAETPTLDRLAAQGARYTNAYTIAGVCAPSRSGIISGMYPTTLGSHHMRCKGVLPPSVQCFPAYLRKAGYYCTNSSKTDYNFSAPKGAWDESGKKATWKKRPKAAPFFAVFNYTGTHESRIRGGGGDAPKLSTLPPYYPDTPVTRADWASNYRNIKNMDTWVAGHLRALEEAGLADDTLVVFWSDHGIGLPRAKRWLYDSGTRVPLIVRIPPKFRVGSQGKPGTVTDELVSFIDLAPTTLNLAGIPAPKLMQGRAFLGADLTPPREYVYGARDRMDERYDIIRMVRDKRHRYIRNYEPFKAYYQYMNTPEKGATMKELRRLHAAGELPAAAELFMADSKPLEELYDLSKDPHEINNLAASPDHQAVLERMRAAHMQWVRDTRDLGLVPEPEITVRTAKYGSGYAILRQPGAEALVERIRATAA
ncbi:sulfatase, partial [bacterium]|nr:sulfatase [bacterium]